MQHVYEKTWLAVLEACFAMSMFRGEITPLFLSLFAFLLAQKALHTLAADRVDYVSPCTDVNVHCCCGAYTAVVMRISTYTQPPNRWSRHRMSGLCTTSAC